MLKWKICMCINYTKCIFVNFQCGGDHNDLFFLWMPTILTEYEIITWYTTEKYAGLIYYDFSCLGIEFSMLSNLTLQSLEYKLV